MPQNFSSLGFAVSEELGNKHIQTNKQTHSLTSYCFHRVINDIETICFIKILSKKFHKFDINNELPFDENIENMISLYTYLTKTLKNGFLRFSGTGWMVTSFLSLK